MGLKQLLEQGQTQLSAGSYPGDTPINDPQSGFVQSNLSTSTYEDETLGQPNNGSVLANTLDNTGLDNTLSPHDIDKPIPPPTANYPLLVSGEFNGSPSSPSPAYNPNNTYLDNISISDPNSPQIGTLDQTGLDNIDNTAEETTIIPNSISYPNNYPALVSGKFDGAPEQYDTPYNLDNTYLDDIPIQTEDSPQIPTLSEINPPTSYGNPTNYPSSATGQWRGASNEFIAPWSYGYQYKDNLFNNLNYVKQQDTLDKTSLDNTHAGNVSTTVPNPNSVWTNYPPLVKGRFNSAPYQFLPPYNTFNPYLDNIPIQTEDSPQRYTLDNTGLDNTNSNADETTFTPNSISAPNNYPLLVTGDWDGAPSQYESPYNADNTYLSIDNTFQANTLGQTSLDNTNSMTMSNIVIPSSTNLPNTYPLLVSGEFNGAPSQYVSPYNANNTYLNNVPIESENSRQKDTILSGETALDNTLQQSLLTTTPPNSITSPTIYPNTPQTNLGEFNGAPSQYQTVYNPSSTYLDQYASVIDENFNGSNTQISSLKRTGMDVENESYDEVAIFPPNPDTITVYPANVTSNTINNVGDAPRRFNQVWKPINRYYNDYIKSLKDQNLV